MWFRAEALSLTALLCALTAVPAGAQAPDAGTGEVSESGDGSGSGTGTGTGTGTGSGSEPESDSASDSVSDSESESDSASDSVSDSDSVPVPDSVSVSDSEAIDAPLDTSEREANSAAYLRKRTAALERALRGAQQDERDAQSWVPWAMTGTGLASVATGLLIGALPTVACDDSCERPFWPAWLVVGGAALATAGTLWLVLDHRDQAELRLRRARIEQQLEYERWNAKPIGRFTLTLSGRL